MESAPRCALRAASTVGLSAGSTYVRAIVQGRANPWFEEFWTPLGSFGHAPLGGDTTYFWAAAHWAAAAEAVARRDLQVPSARSGEECCPSQATSWRRSPHSMTFWSIPFVGSTAGDGSLAAWCLLGDAAHAMAPNLGQGANSALVDALALAEEIARAPSVTEALTHYDQYRRPTARRLQNIAGTFQRLCASGRPPQYRSGMPSASDWPGCRRSPRRASAGPSPPTSKPQEQHQYAAQLSC